MYIQSRRAVTAVLAGTVLIGATLFTGCGNNGNNNVNGPGGQTIANVIDADPEFSILDSVLRVAGLTNTLRGNGPYTLFAPTNSAFEALPEGVLDSLLAGPREDLERVLLYHVIADSLPSQILAVNRIRTVQGDTITILPERQNIRLNNGIQITRPDIEASNGIVHGINGVLIPPVREEPEEDPEPSPEA